MTELVSPIGRDDPETERSRTDADPEGMTTTGVLAVDRVIAEVDHLDKVPLEGHLAVFERAHESLRLALNSTDDDRTDERTDDQSSDQSSDPGAPA